MKKFNVLVISILFSGLVGCQKDQPNPFNIHQTENGITSNRASNSDALLTLRDDDVIDLQIVTVGYNESPSTDDKIYLGVSLSSSSTSGLGSKPMPAQVELRRDEVSQVRDYPVEDTRGVSFQLLFKWKDFRKALSKINSDVTQPIYLNWEFTSPGGTPSSLYSINLSDRLRSAIVYRSSDVILDSVDQTQQQIDLFSKSGVDDTSQQKAKETADVMRNLLLTEGLSKNYPIVEEIQSGKIGSFSYVGLSVSVARN